MAISSNNFSLLILSIFFFSNFLLTQSSPTINTPLINKTCKNISTENPNIPYNFCSTSLHYATILSHRCDLRRLGLLSIGLIRSNVSNTRHLITKLVRNKKIRDRRVRACLFDCLDLYSDAHPAAKRAMSYYRLKKYDDANVQISSVMTGVTTCEDGFKELYKGRKSLLTKRDQDAFRLGAISLAIMKLIH